MKKKLFRVVQNFTRVIKLLHDSPKGPSVTAAKSLPSSQKDTLGSPENLSGKAPDQLAARSVS